MKKLLFTLILVPFISGCLYANVRVPLDEDVSTTTLGDKRGTASIHSVLFLFAWGDAGTHAAAKNGSIETIHHLDQEIYIVGFGLYSKRTTIAYGN